MDVDQAVRPTNVPQTSESLCDAHLSRERVAEHRHTLMLEGVSVAH